MPMSLWSPGHTQTSQNRPGHISDPRRVPVGTVCSGHVWGSPNIAYSTLRDSHFHGARVHPEPDHPVPVLRERFTEQRHHAQSFGARWVLAERREKRGAPGNIVKPLKMKEMISGESFLLNTPKQLLDKVLHPGFKPFMVQVYPPHPDELWCPGYR